MASYLPKFRYGDTYFFFHKKLSFSEKIQSISTKYKNINYSTTASSKLYKSTKSSNHLKPNLKKDINQEIYPLKVNNLLVPS